MSREASGLKQDRKKVFKKAFAVASSTLTSRILGLLRDMAMGALFDRTVTDAWAAAFRIPNLFRRLFGEGSLSISFIPVFIEARSQDPSGVRVKNLVNGFYTVLLIFLAMLTLLAFIFADPLLGFLISDVYRADPHKWELTVSMARIMIGFVFFICTYAYFMGILNALGSFGIPALAPALLNIAMLVFTFLPASAFTPTGAGLAWGVLVGGALQAGFLFYLLHTRGFLPRMQKTLWNADIKKVVMILPAGVLGLGLSQFSILVNLYYSSSLPTGSISYIYWADRLLELPLSLVAVSLGAVLLPELSVLAAGKDLTNFVETAEESFLMNLFLAWPAALGLYFLAQPIVEVLFLRGQFSISDAFATAAVIRVYAIGLIFISCSRVVVPLYSAVGNNWFPAVVTVLSLVLHILLAPKFLKFGLSGIMSAGMIAAAFNLLLLLGGLGRLKLAFRWKVIWLPVAKLFLAGMGMVLSLQIYEYLEFIFAERFQALALLLTISCAMAVYFLLASILRCSEFFKLRLLFWK